MSDRGDYQPRDEQEFQLTIDVPKDIRHDPALLQEWLHTMSVELLNADRITLDPEPDTDAGGGTEGVKVRMYVRPCGPRFLTDDDDDDERDDDDGPGDGGGGDART
jgi:hypothetical protein